MGKLSRKLKAATLFESLIAMIIIVVCLGVGTMIYSNVLSSDKQRLRLKAMLILNSEAERIKKEKKFIDFESKTGEHSIRMTIKDYMGSENLHELTLTAIDRDGRIIGSRNELIFTD